MKEFPDLKTTRCHLVQATLADAEAIFEIVNTLECRMNMPEFYSLFHHKERIRHLIQVLRMRCHSIRIYQSQSKKGILLRLLVQMGVENQVFSI